MGVEEVQFPERRPEATDLKLQTQRRRHERKLLNVDIAFFDPDLELARRLGFERHNEHGVGERIDGHAHVEFRLA